MTLRMNREIALYTGLLRDNRAHKHFAHQIAFLPEGSATLQVEGEEHPCHARLIPAFREHRILREGELAILFIHPLSFPGHSLQLLSRGVSSLLLQECWIQPAEELALRALAEKGENPSTFQELEALFQEIRCQCRSINHPGEERIRQALLYLEDHPDEIVPLEEVARVSSLSSGRFLHLFKETLGITYRRYQLWNRLLLFLKRYSSTEQLTRSALEAGFSDHSHLSRVFRETFGSTPGAILKKRAS